MKNTGSHSEHTNCDHKNSGIVAADVMSTDLFTVDVDENFNYVEVVSDIRHVRHVPVINKQQEVEGIVSVRDLLEYLRSGSASYFIPIKEVMTKRVVTAQATADIVEVASLMAEHDVSAIPILQARKLVGIITERDFVKLVLDGKCCAPVEH